MFFFPFGLFRLAFVVIFCVVLGMIVANVVRMLKETANNAASPTLDVEAAIVAKRTTTDVTHHHTGEVMHTTTHTSHYVTFQFHSNDRMELLVSGRDYGLMAEGDTGTLTFRGTKFISFVRS